MRIELPGQRIDIASDGGTQGRPYEKAKAMRNTLSEAREICAACGAIAIDHREGARHTLLRVRLDDGRVVTVPVPRGAGSAGSLRQTISRTIHKLRVGSWGRR